MDSSETFMDYLRGEVEAAEKRYDRVLATLLSAEDPRGLPGTSEELIEATRIYVGAIRRMAHFVANRAQNRAKRMPQHA